ncbi:YybH family protein [Brevundimonas vesicularis]|uniref:YybH family protein n=1 Tax=Brevundimonas vesicularis TaxID=41276 RepID=UPI00082E1CA0|nr:nuclear transport factor 2 family protein [Brevundimonas vesicularis]
MTRAFMILAFALTAPAGAAFAHDEPAAATVSRAAAEPAQALQGYRAAIEALDGRAGAAFFWPEGQVLEQGGVEGSYTNYLSHHLGPELEAFSAFSFSNYDVDLRTVGDIAYATETYSYRISFKDSSRAAIERRGVATSVLERRRGEWRIITYHSSSRTPRAGG